MREVGITEELISKAEKFLTREAPKIISELQCDKKPIWGISTAHQMIEHLADEIHESFEDNKFHYLNDIRVNEPQLEVSSNGYHESEDECLYKIHPESLRNFEVSKIFLKQRIWAFIGQKPGIIKPETAYAYYGCSKYKELLVFHYHHILHYFRQFGLIKPD